MTRIFVPLMLLALLPGAHADTVHTPLDCVRAGTYEQEPPRDQAQVEASVGHYGTARANASVEAVGVGAHQQCRLPLVRPQ